MSSSNFCQVYNPETIRTRLRAAGVTLRSRAWTDDEVAIVREAYESGQPDLKELAAILRRPYFGVALKVSRLGLSDQARAKTPRDRQLQLKPRPVEPERRWKVFPHPRGMKGKKHTPEAAQRISAAGRQRMAADRANGAGVFSPEHRQRSSDRMVAMNAGRSVTENYSRAKRGYRDDLPGIYFRSRWEANYARYLNLLKTRGDIEHWEYEPDVFWFEAILRGVRSYKPDFKVWEKGQEPYYIEVKGWMDAKSVTKLKRMAIYHPGVRVDVVDQVAYKEIASKLGRMIPGWESEGRR